MKLAYFAVGIIVGWLTIGVLFASSNVEFWTIWEKARIINLLEQIESNTAK